MSRDNDYCAVLFLCAQDALAAGERERGKGRETRRGRHRDRGKETEREGVCVCRGTRTAVPCCCCVLKVPWQLGRKRAREYLCVRVCVYVLRDNVFFVVVLLLMALEALAVGVCKTERERER